MPVQGELYKATRGTGPSDSEHACNGHLLRELVSIGLTLASGLGIDDREHVAIGKGRSTRRAGDRVFEITANVAVGYGLIGILFVLHCPELNSPINLLKVVDASSSMRLFSGLYVVGNRDRCQHADDGYHNHDLDQGESRLIGCCSFHTDLSFGGVNKAAGGLIL